MRVLLIIVGVMCVAAALFFIPVSPPPDKSAPDFVELRPSSPPLHALITQDALVATLQATKAKIIVATIWAPECGACIGEARELAEKKEAWAKRGVALIGLGVADTVKECEEFIEATGARVNFPLYRAKWAVDIYAGGITPAIVVFDATGTVLFKMSQYEANEKEIDLLAAVEEKVTAALAAPRRE